MYKAIDNDPPLCGEHPKEHVKPNWAVTMAHEEWQQVGNTEKHHNMDILKIWKGQKIVLTWVHKKFTEWQISLIFIYCSNYLCVQDSTGNREERIHEYSHAFQSSWIHTYTPLHKMYIFACIDTYTRKYIHTLITSIHKYVKYTYKHTYIHRFVKCIRTHIHTLNIDTHTRRNIRSRRLKGEG